MRRCFRVQRVSSASLRPLMALAIAVALAGSPRPTAAQPARDSVVPLRRLGDLPPGAVAARATAIVLDSDKRSARLLANRCTETNWLAAPSQLYEVRCASSIEANLAAASLPDGEIQLDLELKNASTKPVEVGVAFPLLVSFRQACLT